MRMLRKHLIALWVGGLVVFDCWLSLYGQPQAGQHWVATWTAPQQAPALANAGFDNQTVRLVVHTSVGGEWVRIRLSNAFGATPLKLGAVHIAFREHAGVIVSSTDHGLTFKGHTSVIIPSGAPMISDPVQMGIPASADIVPGCGKDHVGAAAGLRVLHFLRSAKIKSSGISSSRNAITRAATGSRAGLRLTTSSTAKWSSCMALVPLGIRDSLANKFRVAYDPYAAGSVLSTKIHSRPALTGGPSHFRDRWRRQAPYFVCLPLRTEIRY
jgi:hypothetical protein